MVHVLRKTGSSSYNYTSRQNFKTAKNHKIVIWSLALIQKHFLGFFSLFFHFQTSADELFHQTILILINFFTVRRLYQVIWILILLNFSSQSYQSLLACDQSHARSCDHYLFIFLRDMGDAVMADYLSAEHLQTTSKPVNHQNTASSLARITYTRANQNINWYIHIYSN